MGTVVRDKVNIIGISDVLPVKPEVFKQTIVNENLCIPCNKPDIERILSVTFDHTIESFRVIETPIPPKDIKYSAEGEGLTGRKMIVEIRIKQKILYVADEKTQTVHGHHNEIVVSEYIILPLNYKINGKQYDPIQLLEKNMFIVMAYVEDGNIKMLDNRCLFKSVTLFINIDVKKTMGIVGVPIFPKF